MTSEPYLRVPLERRFPRHETRISKTQVKGIISTLNLTDDDFVEDFPNKNDYKRIWDVSDIVVPPTVSTAP